MKNFLLLFLPLGLFAQTNADFENIGIPAAQNFLNDAGGAGVFNSGQAGLHNFYDAQFQYWEGWAISKETDNQTPGFTNQYSAIPGEGWDGSAQYAVGYAFSGNAIRLNGTAKGGVVNGVYVTNSTYAYYSMKDGDGFAKKFGGETGNDPDFFKLTIKKTLNGQIGPDSIDFFLADYRFTNNAQDYLVDAWTWVDLSSLGNADSLLFFLSSSDNGIFGMNTPSYFCIDQLITADMPVSVTDLSVGVGLRVQPNPARDRVWVSWEGAEEMPLRLLDLRGQALLERRIAGGAGYLDLSGVPDGLYFLQPAYGKGAFLIKQSE